MKNIKRPTAAYLTYISLCFISGESVFKTSFLICTSGYGRFFQIRMEYTLTTKTTTIQTRSRYSCVHDAEQMRCILLAVLQCTRASALFLYRTRLLHCERFATHSNQAGQLHQSSLATLFFLYHMSNVSLVPALFSTCGRLSRPDDYDVFPLV